MAEASYCLEGAGWRSRLGGPQPLSSWTGRYTWAVSTTKWHLPRALPRTEQQRHLPSASVDLRQALREFRVEGGASAPGNLIAQVFRELDV